MKKYKALKSFCCNGRFYRRGDDFDDVRQTPNQLLKSKLIEEVKEEAVEEWPLKMSPDEYLEKNPNGKRADLARRVLDQ